MKLKKSVHYLCVLFLMGIILSIKNTSASVTIKTIELDPRYILTYQISENRSEITFDVTAETTGYVGLGLSLNGAMTKADIIIGGIADGLPYFNDYHGPSQGNGRPILDAQNDYKLISTMENETHTQIVFSRLANTCDDDDVPITDAGLRIIWAIGSTDELTRHISQNRGAKAAYILDPQVPDVDLSQYLTYDLTTKTKLPSKHTSYWCTIHHLPDNIPDHHIVATEVLLPTVETRKFTHHMNLFRCDGEASDYDKWNFPNHEGVDCFDLPQNYPANSCRKWEYGWALGGETAIWPADVGFSVKSRQYYQLEVHINNPEKIANESINLEVGFRVYYTTQLRPINGSILSLFTPSNYKVIVPPNSSEFVVASHCLPTCMENHNERFPSTGITIYNVFLHAHMSGRKMRVRHFRGNKELPLILDDENYDYNYQTNRVLATHVTVLPGDQLTTECVYDTHWKMGKSVLGGYSSEQEMCNTFLAYYPEIKDFHGCLDNQVEDETMLRMFNVHDVDGEMAMLLTAEGVKYQSFSSIVDNFNWTLGEKQSFQNQQLQTHQMFCLDQDSSHWNFNATLANYPNSLEKYVPKEMCASSWS